MEGQGKCFVCGKRSCVFYPYLKQHLCKKHFQRLLLRRVKGLLSSNGIHSSIKPSGENPLGREFLSFVSIGGKRSQLVGSNTLEDFAVAVGGYFLLDRKPDIKVSDGKRFNPLYTTSEDEIINFLGTKGTVKRPTKRKGDDALVLSFLKGLEARRPGGMISMVKTGVRLRII